MEAADWGVSPNPLDRSLSAKSSQPKQVHVPGLKVRPVLWWKRFMDIGISIFAILLLSPPMILIAIGIRLDSDGPILFKQLRCGHGGVPFWILKFRTMVPDAEAQKNELSAFNERSGPVFKMSNDPRVTRLGRFLRATSMDELPQLFNVIRGEMSLVGPRPLLLEEVQAFDHWHHRRHEVPPGLTCIWQVYSRDDPSFDRWMQQDLEYIESHSFWLDLILLLKTVPAVLSSQSGPCAR